MRVPPIVTPRALLAPVLLAVLVGLPPPPAAAAAVPTHFEDTMLIGGLDQPTDFARLPDGRVLVTEQRTGNVKLFVDAATSAIALTVPSLNATGNERGLLAMTLDFDWPEKPYVYLYHNRVGGKLRLVRYTASGDLANPTSTNLTLDTPLLLIDDIQDGAFNHNGGALRFGPDKCLYLSVGEDAVRCNAQDSTLLLGAILRLWTRDLDPAGGGPVSRAALAPADNPLVTTNPNAMLVYAYGLRNPFRFHIDPQTGLLYVADVGEVSWEEIDEVGPGDNLGWPYREGFAVISPFSCAEPGGSGTGGYTPPIHTLVSSGSAIMSAGVYRRVAGAPANWPLEYDGSLFYSEYYSGILRRLARDANGFWALAPAVPGQPSPDDWGQGFRYGVEYLPAGDGSVWWLQQFDDFQSSASGSLHRLRYIDPTAGVTPGAGGAQALAAAPNPFRGRVELSFRAEAPERVRLAVLDLAGREVRVLLDGQTPGATRITWDGTDGAGRRLAPGLYVARLERSGGPATSLRIVLSD